MEFGYVPPGAAISSMAISLTSTDLLEKLADGHFRCLIEPLREALVTFVFQKSFVGPCELFGECILVCHLFRDVVFVCQHDVLGAFPVTLFTAARQ